jgi:hypothetical protein
MKTQLNDQLIDEAADPNHTASLDQTAPHRNASALNASATASSPAILPPAESPSASPELLRKLEQKRLKALQRKQRADSFLNKLTDPQLAKLLAWFEDEENLVVVYHHVTSPAPDGLGLQVSLPTLRRIRAHIVATHSNSRTTEILDTISEMDADPSESTRIQGAINQLLHEKAFELIRTEPGGDELRDLLATIEKLSALDLKRQKLALDREKMLRRARQAATPPPARRHHVKLEVVPSTPTTTAAPPAHNSHISHSSHHSHQPEFLAPVPDIVVSN